MNNNPKHNDELIKVYQDTLDKSSDYSIGNTVKYIKPDIDGSLPPFKLTVAQAELSKNVFVINTDTVSAAREYAQNGRVAVLNMASAKKSGGGVLNGARAQEECLFRCSNLNLSVHQDFYPLGSDESLYTKDATFFKDKDYNKIASYFEADVITIPAINLNPKSRYDDILTEKPADYEEVTKTKIRTMLYLAAINGCENIILGAWGCGVFKNDPVFIAKTFYDVIYEEKYNRMFHTIAFAVINDHNSVANNYEIFAKQFGAEEFEDTFNF